MVRLWVTGAGWPVSSLEVEAAAGYFAVGAVAMLGEDTDHAGGYGDRLIGTEEKASLWRIGDGR